VTAVQVVLGPFLPGGEEEAAPASAQIRVPIQEYLKTGL